MHGNVSLPVGSLTTLLALKPVLWARESPAYPQKCGTATNTCPRNPQCEIQNNLPSAPKVAGVQGAASASPATCSRATPAPEGPEGTPVWDGTPCFSQQHFDFISI